MSNHKEDIENMHQCLRCTIMWLNGACRDAEKIKDPVLKEKLIYLRANALETFDYFNKRIGVTEEVTRILRSSGGTNEEKSHL